ncbi:MAG: methyltransferase domain-containing protein [Chloroflexi bacterium]|nr:methyltransferase domain-containing protein [Chloroflexota bacterium]
MRTLLRAAFHLLYNPFAFSYDFVSWAVSIGQWRQWQRQSLPHIVGTRLLELAHGTGNLQIDLARAGHRSIALDRSPHMGRIAKHKLATRHLRPPFVRAGAQALPFPAGHFTTLLTTFPSDFIAEPATARECWRVLAPGGRLIIVPAARIVPAHLADTLALWLFKLTGQSAPPDPEQWAARLTRPYHETGFQTRVATTTLPRSLVWIILADKPGGME